MGILEKRNREVKKRFRRNAGSRRRGKVKTTFVRAKSSIKGICKKGLIRNRKVWRINLAIRRRGRVL